MQSNWMRKLAGGLGQSAADRANPVLMALVLIGAGVASWKLMTLPVRGQAPVSVVVPALSSSELAGEAAFNQHCMSCHGKNGAGTKAGPPLVHKIYEPSHHSDRSFYRAVKEGVTAHHWQFGNMPSLPAVTDPEIGLIVGYVRALQRANGIE